MSRLTDREWDALSDSWSCDYCEPEKRGLRKEFDALLVSRQTQGVGMTEHLSDQQIARVEALQVASTIGRKSAGAFGGSTPPETQDLVDLAEYILNGTHPMERYYEMQKERYGDADNVRDA